MSVVSLTSLFLVGICWKSIQSYGVSPEVFKTSAAKCLELSRDPYFDIDFVVGKPWRIYYTWNVHMEMKCLDVNFKNATKGIIQRFYNDMAEYVETQPTWDAATMYMSMGSAKEHEILLFANQGAAGTFDGVPNAMKRATAIAPQRQGVPILKFFIKILHGGKYLLIADCMIGVASLASREHPPYRTEIASVAASLKLLGEGSPACTKESKKDESVYY